MPKLNGFGPAMFGVWGVLCIFMVLPFAGSSGNSLYTRSLKPEGYIGNLPA
jgi:hypothetical protein